MANHKRRSFINQDKLTQIHSDQHGKKQSEQLGLQSLVARAYWPCLSQKLIENGRG